MSRGIGKTQRAVLETIDTVRTRLSITQVAGKVYGEAKVTPKAYGATLRAVRGLQARGLLADTKQVQTPEMHERSVRASKVRLGLDPDKPIEMSDLVAMFKEEAAKT